MRRREFLAAATAASALSFGRTARAQKSRQADPAKLARIAVMTLDFNAILKLPTQPASPNRTLEILDVPEMLADMYGVHNVEFQHTHILSTEASYLRDLRARLDKAQSRMSNVNLEFGTSNISALDPADREKAVQMTMQWVDFALVLGTPRVMINQGALTEESKVWAIPALKRMVDYGRSKGIKVSVETRLAFGGGRGRGAGPGGAAAGAPPAVGPATAASPAVTPAAPPAGPATTPPAPPPPAAVPPTNPAAGRAPGTVSAATPAPATMTTPPTWVLLAELIKNAGAYSNVDIGNVNAQDQGELHASLRALLPLTVGNIHTRISPAFDLPTALRFITANLGYEGLFSIEAPGGHDAVRYIYNVILDTI
ncbi:MAG: TIM barrel protein [Acidobacteriota bacterium]